MEDNPLLEIVIDIPEHLEDKEWRKCCIYRVPGRLRSVNEEAYTPQFVSIGPFHYKKPRFKAMETHKPRYLTALLTRIKTSKTDLLRVFEKPDYKRKVRDCYAGKINLNDEDFINMILIDAAFVLELFMRNYKDKDTDESLSEDYILSKPSLRRCVQLDLLLLENQLPFFVLNDLYKEVNLMEHTSFLKLACRFFDEYGNEPSTSELNASNEIKHFADMIRFRYLSSMRSMIKIGKPNNKLPSASKLNDSGVEFKVAGENSCLLDISFDKDEKLKHNACLNSSWLLHCLPCLKGVSWLEKLQPCLRIPSFLVDDTTECVFRNLMALEQCHYPYETYICSYVIFIDCLIDNEKDVDLLVDKEVIVNSYGSNRAVAELVNKLCGRIEERKSCYDELVKCLDTHHKKEGNHIMAALTNIYFRDVWRGTGTVVALLIVAVTFWNVLRPFVL